MRPEKAPPFGLVPVEVAYEALEMLGVYSGSCRKYDPMDPLGTGE